MISKHRRRLTKANRPNPVHVSDAVPIGSPARDFQPVRNLSALERLGAVIALRMIQGAKLHGRMIVRGSIRDHDLLALVGLELADSEKKLTPAGLAQEFSTQHARLQGRTNPSLPVLDRNIETLGRLLRLNSSECAVLHLAVVVSRVRQFVDLFNACGMIPELLFDLVRYATGESRKRIEDALAPNSNLRRAGLLEEFYAGQQHSNPLELEGSVASQLLSPGFDANSILRRLLRPAPPPGLGLADFEHLPEKDVIRRYVAAAIQDRRSGVNILLHGLPGTGKTEFVRALAAELGARLCEVPVEDERGSAVTGRARFKAFALAQRLLAHERKHLLLFDEVEDVFGSGSRANAIATLGHRTRDPEVLAKGWINETLESNPVPTLWVCNDIEAMDAAYLRRFDLVANFRAPTQAVRTRLVRRYFPGETLSDQGVAALASFDPLPPSQIERVARIVSALNSTSTMQRDFEARQILTMSLRSMGLGTTTRAAVLPGDYDLSLLNTDRNLLSIIDGLRAGRPARLCLYGRPGTGKTALGHHLARSLDRPLHVKRASDLVSMWVGGTEKNLAEAFRAASDEGAILLVDEADSFLQDRARAQRSWEVTAVNEMLTQMEAFDGIFIASTNLMDSLDAASLRRFDFKVRFDYLDRPRRLSLFQNALNGKLITDAERQRIGRLESLAPGDVANALRQLRVTGHEPTAARLLDLVEAELRLKPDAPALPIGFVH